MNTRTIAFAACAALVTAASGSVVGVDFGDINNTTPGNYNNVDHVQNPIFNMIDTDGNGTGYTLNVTDAFWPGSNQNGTATPGGDAAGIPTAATADNLFGSLVEFGGFLEPTGGVTIGGLDATGNTAYDFLFFGSRMGVSDNRETMYTATGANSAFALLDTANNTHNVALVSGIIADANGEITISVTAGPNNTNSSGFYYLGYLEFTAVPVPAPASIALFGLGSFVAIRHRR